jgi:hypothetical protein
MSAKAPPLRSTGAPTPARPAVSAALAGPALGNQLAQSLHRRVVIRAKLELGGSDDPEEREADAVADRVMRMPDGACCAACARDEEKVRRTSNGRAPSRTALSPGSERQIREATHGGDPLSPQLRAFFEPRMGGDLGAVRVHRDADAHSSARTLGARAFAVGGHIAFAAGQWSPDTGAGRHLIAHELAHVGQDASAVRRDSPAPTPAAVTPLPPDPASITAAVDTIIDALEGYTSSADSERILNQFRGKSTATVLALMEEVKRRGGTRGKNADEMVDWLLGDLTGENRHELRNILAVSRSADVERIVTAEIKNRLEGYTSEADSAEIVALFAGFPGAGIDGLLVHLETAMRQDRDVMRAQLFGDLDRVNAERLRQLFFIQGGPLAASYAAGWTASKIYGLLKGYTSHSDSTDIVWNFQTTPGNDLRGLVLVRLDALCRSNRNQPAQDALMHDIDASDYERLRGMGGIALSPYQDTRKTAEKAFSAAEWALIVVEWAVCGVVGVVTGVASAIWDLLKGVKDVVVGIWDLIWSLVYLLSFGAAGSDNWLRVKTFFSGIGTLFTDPGKVWDSYWDEQALEFHTIEGTFSDCRRAEFLVRKFVSAVVNIALIFLAGYGVAKGVVSGVRAVAEGAELADIIGVRGVVSVAGRLATRRIGRFVAASSEVAAALLKAISQPRALLSSISARVRVVLIAADDVGYWQYLRQQAGAAVDAGTEAGADRLARERKFWEEQRRYWRARGEDQQTRLQGLSDDTTTVQNNLESGQQPEDPGVTSQIASDARQLDEDSAKLQGEVTGGSTAQPLSAVKDPEPAPDRPVGPIPDLPGPRGPLGFPPSTGPSEAAARAVLDALRDATVPPPARGIAVGVFSHVDGSVTVGPSGGAERVETVRAALQGRVPANWQIGPAELTPTLVHPEGLRPWVNPKGIIQPGRATCAECRLSVGGRQNPSPVIGMTVLQWGGDQPLRFTDPATGIMRPCESCATNVDRIMEPINVVPAAK